MGRPMCCIRLVLEENNKRQGRCKDKRGDTVATEPVVCAHDTETIIFYLYVGDGRGWRKLILTKPPLQSSAIV